MPSVPIDAAMGRGSSVTFARLLKHPFMLDLMEATISEVQAELRCNSLSCRELVDFYFQRIAAYDKRNTEINAILHLNESALSEAEALDAAFKSAPQPLPPLWGIPILLKDNYDSVGSPTTCGSKSLENNYPSTDSTVVARLRQAGAVILGKTNLSEFALTGSTRSSLGGQTKNPYDLERTPGGSSGGTGAALAANFALVGMGTDTVNSVRSPASANSVVGLRPTAGLVSRAGILPVSSTQDVAGPLARTVSDIAITLDAIAGHDRADPVTALSGSHVPASYRNALVPAGLNGLKVGILKNYSGTSDENREVNKVIQTSIWIMEQQGAHALEIEAPHLDPEMLSEELDVQKWEYRTTINQYLANESGGAQKKTLAEIIASGEYDKEMIHGILLRAEQATDGITSPDYLRQLACIQRLKINLASVLAENDVDVLVFPEQRCLVSTIEERTQPQRNGILAALTGYPEITVPAGFSEPSEAAPVGVPIGISMLGRPWDEALLLGIAYDFEQATKARHAPLSTPSL